MYNKLPGTAGSGISDHYSKTYSARNRNSPGPTAALGAQLRCQPLVEPFSLSERDTARDYTYKVFNATGETLKRGLQSLCTTD